MRLPSRRPNVITAFSGFSFLGRKSEPHRSSSLPPEIDPVLQLGLDEPGRKGFYCCVSVAVRERARVADLETISAEQPLVTFK
jgi:hypothetical protein